MRNQAPAYSEILDEFDIVSTPSSIQMTCQDDYTFDPFPGYCEANVCPTEGILAHIQNMLSHDCGGGSTASSTNAGDLGASKLTRTEGRCKQWCVEPKYKGPDKLLECMPSGTYSVYEM